MKVNAMVLTDAQNKIVAKATKKMLMVGII